jgi:O-antigen/teichoic acid export membrane protein
VILAPLVANIFDDMRLVTYFYVVSAALVIETFGYFICMLLRREMQFQQYALVNLAGTISVNSAAILLILLDFSYMSFAWAWLATAVVVSVLAAAIWRKRKFEIFVPLFRGVRAVMVFGGYHGGTQFAYKLFESAPYLILGRVISLDAAAMFHRSLMICQLPDKLFLAGAASVMFPAFSAEVRQGRSLTRPYLRALEVITALQWPALLLLAVLAYPVVDLLLGQQWHEAVPMVAVMAAAGLFSFTLHVNYAVLMAVGALRFVFLRAAIVYSVSAVVIAAAAFVGLHAVAWSMFIIIPFHAFVDITFVRRSIGVRWSEIAMAVRGSAVVAGTTALGPLVIAILATPKFELALPAALVAALAGGVGWILGLLLTRHPLLAEIKRLLPVRIQALATSASAPAAE